MKPQPKTAPDARAFEEIMRKKVGLGEAEIVGADPITGKTQYRILRGKGWTR